MVFEHNSNMNNLIHNYPNFSLPFSPPPPSLSPPPPSLSLVMKFRSCTIRSVQDVTHDSKLFTIDIPPSCSMSVPIGHHVSIRPNEPSSDLERSYTPVAPLSSTPVAPLSSTLVAPLSSASHSSTRNSNNTIELLIKLYKDGAMSQHLAKLAAGKLIIDSYGV